MISLPFGDRRDAGQLLADEIRPTIWDDSVVIALPRGGVPVGFAVAECLTLPLDILIARKLGVPWEPELAMGAIAGTVSVLDEELIGRLGIGAEEIEAVASQEKAEMKRREDLYRGGAPPLVLTGRRVVLVDDGIAMGSTMAAAARSVRKLRPAGLTIAVPVGSRAACERLRTEADSLVCLATPDPFYSVSQWYADFEEVSDDEVRALLKNRNWNMM